MAAPPPLFVYYSAKKLPPRVGFPPRQKNGWAANGVDPTSACLTCRLLIAYVVLGTLTRYKSGKETMQVRNGTAYVHEIPLRDSCFAETGN